MTDRVKLKDVKSNSLLVGGNRASSVLSHKLSHRLESFQGTALFLTLTYRRDDYEKPSALYKAQSEERHVRLFIRRLANYLGCSLNGRWIRKMEFTRSGWVHFHLIIDSPRRIPHKDLESIWGHGFVWINQCHWKHIKYFCKYIAKSESGCPPYLYNERSRSVKIVATSPKFWDTKPNPRKKSSRGITWAVFVPLVEVWQPKTIVKTMEGQTTVHAPLFNVMQSLISNGSMLLGRQDEYISLASCHNTITKTLRQLKHVDSASTAPSPEGAGAAAGTSLDNGLNSAHSVNDYSDAVRKYQDWELRVLESTGIFTERVNTYA